MILRRFLTLQNTKSGQIVLKRFYNFISKFTPVRQSGIENYFQNILEIFFSVLSSERDVNYEDLEKQVFKRELLKTFFPSVL